MEYIYVFIIKKIAIIIYSDNMFMYKNHLEELNTFRDVCDYCSKHNLKIYIPNSSSFIQRIQIHKLDSIVLSYDNLIPTKEEALFIESLFNK